jgi:hypothetical protein
VGSGAKGHCDSLKQSQEKRFGDLSDDLSVNQQTKIIAD